MNNHLPVLTLIGLLGFFFLDHARAAQEDRAPASREPQVLVLANEATLVGQFKRSETGDYILDSQQGSSVFKAKDVLRLCPTRRDAYHYLKTRANLRDADERFRLARWCWTQQLIEETIEELEATLGYRPQHREAQGMLRLAKLALTEKTAKATAAAPPSSMPPPSVPIKNELRAKPDPSAETPTTDRKPPATQTPERAWSFEDWQKAFADENIMHFTRHIQPIVINGCGTGACHGREEGQLAFALRRPAGGWNSFTPEITRHNLGQVLKLIDPLDFQQSPLLKKALEPHGGGQRAPLGSVDHVAFRTIHGWTQRVSPSSGIAAQRPSQTAEPPVTSSTIGQAGGFASTQAGASPRPRVADSGSMPWRDGAPITEEEKKQQMQQFQPRGLLDRLTGRQETSPVTPKGPSVAAGTPPMLFQGQVVSSSPTLTTPLAEEVITVDAKPTRHDAKPTMNDAKEAPSAKNPNDHDPYDPAPFNRQFHPQRS